METKSFFKTVATVLILLLLSAAEVAAENINIKGTIKDKKSKEPLIGATIRILGSNKGAITDIDGNYKLVGILEGIYDVEIKYVGYKTEIRKKVQIKNGDLIDLSMELESDNHVLSDVVVVANKNRENENMALLEQRKSIVAIQSVGAKELSRKGVGDAEAAVAKVSGISKQSGVKNVFVRGLGDRYNITTLNGFPIPSEDPEYKNISLEFFSTDIIQSVGVNKVFNANGTSDVGGANIDVSSKELIKDKNLSIGVSGGFNTKTLTAGFLKADGVNGLGITNNTKPSDDVSLYSFRNKLDPSKQNLQINQSYKIAGGKKLYLGKQQNPLSLFLVATHNKDYSYYEEEIRNTLTDGTISRDQTGQKYTENTNQLILANTGLRLNNKHTLQYNFMMIHNNTRFVGDYKGMDAKYDRTDEALGFTRRQQTNDNLLFVNQLITNWALTQKLNFEAGAAYNIINALEPDRRINDLVKAEQGYVPTKGDGVQQRFFSTLKDKDLNVNAALFYKLPDSFDGASNIKAGYKGRFSTNNFEANAYNMKPMAQSVIDIDDIKFDDYFTQAHLDDEWFTLDRIQDTYEVTKNIHSAYVEGTYQLAHNLIANAGIKYDNVTLGIDYELNSGSGTREIDKSYFLPSLNLKYDLSKKQSLRLGASKTYTLPQAKEFAPFRYVNINFNSQGNPDLKPSDNYNIDLKWDYYPSLSEVFSVTAFYKYIKNPISRIEINSAGGYLSYENISDKATVAGIEIEIRKNIFNKQTNGSKAEVNRLSFGLNGSYIYTHAKVPFATNPTGSQLEGAAPWIVNADLSHNFTTGSKTFINTLVFNYFSERIYTIGTGGYQDIMENGVPTLDFISSAKFSKYITLNLKMQNLLNSAHRLTRKGNGGNEVVLSKYKKGLNLSLGVSCSF